jgi:hypothetical protein
MLVKEITGQSEREKENGTLAAAAAQADRTPRPGPRGSGNLCAKVLGIGDAKALSVHLANPRVTKERRRRWTGFAVALTVTFTVCDAQQIGLSPSGGFLLPIKKLALLSPVRPEQKTPPILTPLRLCNEAFVSRKQLSGTPSAFDGSRGFRFALIPAESGFKPLCPQPNSGESSRGPPRRAPVISLFVT